MVWLKMVNKTESSPNLINPDPVRTCVAISRELWELLKIESIREHQTLSALIERYVRAGIAAKAAETVNND